MARGEPRRPQRRGGNGALCGMAQAAGIVCFRSSLRSERRAPTAPAHLVVLGVVDVHGHRVHMGLRSGRGVGGREAGVVGAAGGTEIVWWTTLAEAAGDSS